MKRHAGRFDYVQELGLEIVASLIDIRNCVNGSVRGHLARTKASSCCIDAIRIDVFWH